MQSPRNARRARRAHDALGSAPARYIEQCSDDKTSLVAQALGDALSDFRHLCDAYGLDFDSVNARGADHYAEEIASPDL